jgi:hypothetical protein
MERGVQTGPDARRKNGERRINKAWGLEEERWKAHEQG